MKRTFICLFSFVFIFSATDRRTQYFLTEHDFLTNNSSSKIAVTGQSYYRVEYDSNDRVITKSKVDERKKVMTLELYKYDDSTGILREKNIFNENRKLLSRTVFQQEKNSLEFLQYLYNMDSTEVYGDRYTRTIFQDDEKPTVHKFFDVNGFNYGEIGFFYDSSGRLSSQVWIQMPSERVIRRWKYVPIQETDITRIMEYDSLGALIIDVKLDGQGREEILTFTAPEDFSFVDHTRTSFIMEDNLENGEIIWIEVDTVENRMDSTRIHHLHGETLSPGAYNILPPSPLIDGHVYHIIFRGTTKHGNIAIQKMIREVTYDISAPEITLLMDSRISRPEVAYDTSEPLKSAIFNWLPGFPNDSIASIEVQFSEKDLNKASKGKFIPENNPDLVDSVQYDVSMIGIDRAGNMSKTAVALRIQCDKTPPIKVLSPQVGEYVNNMNLHFSLNEDLNKGTFTIARSEESNHPQVLSVVNIPDTLLTIGEHSFNLEQSYSFVDGMMYSLTIFCKDKYGYDSNRETIDSLHFDVTPPVFSLVDPFNDSYINHNGFIYSTDEPLSLAKLKWENIGMIQDSFAPHEFNLNLAELFSGDSVQISFDDSLTLVDSAQYRLTVIGFDLAGNQSDTIFIEPITHDISPPIISEVNPPNNSFVNSVDISLSISEDLQLGSAVFFQVDGRTDSLSPHSLQFSGEMLHIGPHDSLDFSQYNLLSDSSIYDIEISGQDLAGNNAKVYKITNVTYDISDPIISEVYPPGNSFINKDSLAFVLSEDIQYGWYKLINEKEETVETSIFEKDQLKGSLHFGTFSLDESEVDGIVNTLTFNLLDFAGNQSQTSFDSITFDFTPPQIQLFIDSYINKPKIKFEASEYLQSGRMVWLPGWNIDIIDTVSIQFTEVDFDSSGKTEFIPMEMQKIENGGLKDSIIYTVSFEGIDRAGNVNDPLQISDIHFDITNPVITIAPPEKNIYLAHIEINYTPNEELSSCTIEILSNEKESLHNFDVEKTLLNAKENTIDIVPFYEFEDVQNYYINISGIDLAGNSSKIASVSGIYFDDVPTEVIIIYPAEGGFINNREVSYFLNEPLMSGDFFWEQTGGPPDYSAPHQVSLVNEELTKGEKPYITLTNSPVLRDSAIYKVRFAGVNMAGSGLDSIIVPNVTFDITLPQFYDVLPKDSTTFNSALFYHMSEDLKSGTVSWFIPEEDSAQIFSFDLQTEDLSKGAHEIVVSERFQGIEEGKSYLVEFTGVDLAENESLPFTISKIVYDITPPVFTNVIPSTESYLNSPDISYEINEDLHSGSFSWDFGWRREFKYDFELDELGSGGHVLKNVLPQDVLDEDKDNNLIIIGTDLAGNSSSIELSNIVYDVTPPELIIKYPETNDVLTIVEFAFTISEVLKDGRFICTQTAGAFDEESPRLIQLSGYELEKSQKSKKPPLNKTTLNNGSVYEIEFKGVDFADNFAKPSVVSNVLFDNENPEIIILAPANNEIVYGASISYSLSENLKEGKIIWKKKEGKFSLMGLILSLFSFLSSDSKEIDMVEKELTKGDHKKIVPYNQTELKTGEIYSLTIQGVDMGGNIGDSAVIQEIQVMNSSK